MIKGFFIIISVLSFCFAESRMLPKDWDRFRRRDCQRNLISKQEMEKKEYLLIIIGIIDGDSICGEDKDGLHYHIRLDGIDAPEYRQSHYREAKVFLAEKIWQKEICLQVKEFDRYNRIIGRLYPTDSGSCQKKGDSINLLMVREGWAWVYRYFFEEGEFFSKKDFEEAEDSARRERKGLWENPDPQNPYQCRKTRKCR